MLIEDLMSDNEIMTATGVAKEAFNNNKNLTSSNMVSRKKWFNLMVKWACYCTVVKRERKTVRDWIFLRLRRVKSADGVSNEKKKRLKEKRPLLEKFKMGTGMDIY